MRFPARVPLALLAAGAIVLGALGAAAPAAEPFYVDLLRQGLAARASGQHAEAARVLRLAAFGLLEEPPLLAQALAHLALAQAASADGEGFSETVRRLSQVETRFQGYAAAEIAAETRGQLEAEIARRVPAAALRLDPAFAHLVPEVVAEAGGRRSRRQADPSPGVATPPAPPAPAASAPGTTAPPDVPSDPPATVPPVPSPSAEAPAAQPASVSPEPWPGPTPEEAAKLERARRLLAEARVASDLAGALALAREVADADARNREAQHLVARIAYSASSWDQAVLYFERGGVPADATLAFYMAVALHESGRAARAAEVLRGALPGLRRTPYVDAYVTRILGAGGG